METAQKICRYHEGYKNPAVKDLKLDSAKIYSKKSRDLIDLEEPLTDNIWSSFKTTFSFLQPPLGVSSPLCKCPVEALLKHYPSLNYDIKAYIVLFLTKEKFVGNSDSETITKMSLSGIFFLPL